MKGMTSLAIFIPLKALPRAKSRLKEHLRAQEHRRAVETMFLHVVRTVQQAQIPGRLFVLTGDQRGVHLARQAGAIPLPESGMWRLEGTGWGEPPLLFDPRGEVEWPLNRILTDVLTWAEQAGWTRALILPADLPALTVSDVRRIWQASIHTPIPHIVLAPDRNEEGTNALLLAPPTALTPTFGRGSFARHVMWAHRHHLHVRIIRSPGLAVDVDRIQDWREIGGTLSKSPLT